MAVYRICSCSTAPPSRIIILQIQASEFNLKIAFTFTTAAAAPVSWKGKGCLEWVRSTRSLNHFRTEVIGKHPAEGLCRKCNTPCLRMQVQHLCQHGRMCSKRKVKDYVDATARGKWSKTRYKE